ncbi:MAG: helix-turn-helix transcriptional regulator [Clostridiales bacterium]|nr:helix-turn-helix transcriptional regulator [Clostridiales bacterium]
MFDTVKFGKAISTLRKNADMTQNEVADRLNLTRQAVSKYERGESFPDISVLVMMSDLYGITLDKLIGYGGATNGESEILKSVANGDQNVVADNIVDIVNLAPLLKPSVLTKLSTGFESKGIDISNVIALAEYLNDDSVVRLIENATFDDISDEMIEKFIPLLTKESKYAVFNRILDGDMDWHYIVALLPYADYLSSQVEAAVVEGVLPWEALDLIREYRLKQV